MEKQNQIKRTLSQPDSIAHVTQRLKSPDNLNRTQLAVELCEYFDFIDPKGHPQVAGCLKALRELEKQGQFILPVAQINGGERSARQRRLDEPVPPPRLLPDDAGKIEQLKLVRVETEPLMRLWNELMIQDHPQGERPLVGRQLRYLVQSEHGWLGGIGFSAAALNLQARDQWIGWDWEARQEGLHSVVGMSRLLIRAGVVCRNLASRVLGMAVRTLPKDFESRYGYRPLLLESFVDETHQGTSYKAANWQWIGRTQGRGRQDRQREAAESIKDIYVYPLEEDFRVKLGLPKDAGLGKLALIESVQGENWAQQEFGGAPLGDKRLSKRLIEIGLDKAQNPGRSYSGATQGAWPKVKAYYRFIDQPDASGVTLDNILLPHRLQTVRRMKAEKRVLCIQDGTDLNYSHLNDCEGLGDIGKNQTGAVSKGLHLHSTLAVTTEGLALGVLQAQCKAEHFNVESDPATETEPPAEKKTGYWLDGLRDGMALKAEMPHTALIHVMDREADFFELFDLQRRECPSVDLLVRAKHNRTTTGKCKLFDSIKHSPIQTHLEIAIPRQSARAKKSKQKARPKRPARVAQVALRYKQVTLKPPKGYKSKEPITLWAVHIREGDPPVDQPRLEWLLLTTVVIESEQDALNCLRWYQLRWRIEDWHRVLKSGCRVEKLAHKTAERLKSAIAINLVIAWRIMLMTLLGRETPELPADVMFSDVEIEVLNAYAQKKNYTSPSSLGEAVKLVAKMGGYLDRKHDPEPGHQIMWQGYTYLQAMCEGFLLLSG